MIPWKVQLVQHRVNHTVNDIVELREVVNNSTVTCLETHLVGPSTNSESHKSPPTRSNPASLTSVVVDLDGSSETDPEPTTFGTDVLSKLIVK